jgi:hypothetical protein
MAEIQNFGFTKVLWAAGQGPDQVRFWLDWVREALACERSACGLNSRLERMSAAKSSKLRAKGQELRAGF